MTDRASVSGTTQKNPSATTTELEGNGAYQPEPERRVVPCATTTPERHERGEFPMTCYECHVWADS